MFGCSLASVLLGLMSGRSLLISPLCSRLPSAAIRYTLCYRPPEVSWRQVDTLGFGMHQQTAREDRRSPDVLHVNGDLEVGNEYIESSSFPKQETQHKAVTSHVVLDIFPIFTASCSFNNSHSF